MTKHSIISISSPSILGMRRFLLRSSAVACTTILFLLATGCNMFNSIESTLGVGSSNTGDFSKTVFLGDSLTAGFQNGSLLDTQQPNGYANLIAKQAGFQLALPLIAPPGAPAVLKLVSVGPPPVIQQESGITTGRDNPTVQATDLAVPGHLLTDLINRAPVAVPVSNEDIITDLVLGFPGLAAGQDYTQLQWAQKLAPTTLFLWIGSNDALPAIHSGKPSSMTPAAQFTTEFTQLMQTLHTKTKAALIVANVPDVTEAPYLSPGSLVLAEFSASSGMSAAQLSAKLGIQNGDLVNPNGLQQIQAILAGKQAGPVTDSGFLTPAEVLTVQTTIDQYNTAIAAQVAAVGGTLVDLHTTLKQLHDNPPTINGTKATFAFLGGIFSLDGEHPTNTGYALVANMFIDKLNQTLSKKIPDVNVSAIAQTDPLFPSNLPKAVRRMHIPSSAAQSLDWMMQRTPNR